MEYTPQQQQVIKLHDRNLLVAAAAGSGKTAVLVERIVKMIADEDKKIDIDRLLVVTFTKAAAAQMRERIGSAISKKIMEQPDNEHLKKQELLLHNAQITTIDSFCLYVVRNNFNDIDLEPDFRIADEGEIKLLKKEAMAETMEVFFEEASEDFHYLLEAFCPDGKEMMLEEYIEKIYRFSQSYPFPEEWLRQCTDNYEAVTVEEMQALPFMQQGMRHVHLVLEAAMAQYEEAMNISKLTAGPAAYLKNLADEYDMLKHLSACTDYMHMADAFENVAFSRLSRVGSDCMPELKLRVQDIRNTVKGAMEKIRKKYFFDTPQNVFNDLKISGRLARTLIALTLKFEELFSEKKRKRKVVDFNDIEHFALKILITHEDGKYVPTQTAKEYSDYFHEILIDEYQDSNLVQEYLLWAVSGETDGRENRFMVGDVKQSIYKFRLARPEIFMEKYDTYTKQESKSQKIELSMNFRSRREVVDSVNMVFRRIMRKELGNIDYSEDAYLYYGASYKGGNAEENEGEAVKERYKTEYAVIDTGDIKSEEARETEAMYIAKRIHEIVGKLPVTGKDGIMRPASYKDIVILLRATTGFDEVFKRVFEKEEIPFFIPSKTGYFTTEEVVTLLNFLKVLTNPYQDIPLFGVMKSVLFNFSENEIALLRQEKKEHLYTSILKVCDTDEKCRNFAAFIDKYRDMAVYMPIYELLLAIIRETYYIEILSALPNGVQKCANVNMLLEKAVAYGETSYRGLFHFVRYIEQLVKYEVDYGEANVADESADVVSMYTIHKSKGLEFPICFLAGTGKGINLRDDYQPVLMDIEMGVSTKVIDVEKRVYADSIYRNMMEIKGISDVIGEEIRLLYVAMTRAKEKLIITGTTNKAREKFEAGSNTIDYIKLTEMKSFMDMLVLGISEDEDKIRVHITNRDETEEALVKRDVSLMLLKQQIDEAVREKNNDAYINAELYSRLKERLALRYPHENLSNLYTKTTVSNLKMEAMEKLYQEEEGIQQFVFEENEEEYIPDFIEKKERVSGVKRGTAYHRVLELMNLDEAENEGAIAKQIDEMIERKEIDASYKEMVSFNKLWGFAKSNMAQRMRKASHEGRLFLEQPFVMGIPANEVDATFPKEEMLLIQGIIDVYFEEDGELVLADYKTDRVNDENELINRYRAQLDYYAKALQQLTGKHVKEKIIYSLYLMKEISI